MRFNTWTLGMGSNSAFRALVTVLLTTCVWLASTSACHAHEGTTPSNTIPSKHGAYTFGVVPQYEQRKLFRIWLPILAELEKRTGLKFALKGSSQIPVFEKKFLHGGFDFAYMNPYHIIKAYQSQGYIPLVRDGNRSLKGVLVVNVESDIHTLQDLDGKTIAFPSPNSLGASLLIRADLTKRFHIKFEPSYVQTHSSVYLHVAKNLAVAGGGVEQTLESQQPEVKTRLRTIYETTALPQHPIAVHPRVPKTDRENVRKALLEIAAEEQGRAWFSLIPMQDVVSTNISDYSALETWGLDEFYVSE